MSYYITHIVAERLPKTGFKQLSFLTSNKENYPRVFFWGYNGSTRLTEDQLSEEIAEGKIIRLANPKVVEKERFLWIDADGKIFESEEIFSQKIFVEFSGLRKSKEIFAAKNIESLLSGVRKRIAI